MNQLPMSSSWLCSRLMVDMQRVVAVVETHCQLYKANTLGSSSNLTMSDLRLAGVRVIGEGKLYVCQPAALEAALGRY